MLPVRGQASIDRHGVEVCEDGTWAGESAAWRKISQSEVKGTVLSRAGRFWTDFMQIFEMRQLHGVR